MMNPNVPDGAALFSYPAFHRWLTFVGIVFFVAMLLLALSVPYISAYEKGIRLILGLRVILFWAIFMLVFGSFAILCLRSFRLTKDSVAVAEEGIWYVAPATVPVFIAWRDVSAISAHDFLGQLAIEDTNSRTIRAQYVLKDFDRLRELIYANLPDRVKMSLQRSGFSQSKSLTFVLIGSLLLLGLLAMRNLQSGDHLPSLLLLGTCLPGLWELLTEPRKINLTGSSVIIRRAFSREDIPWNEIKTIALTMGTYQSRKFATVVIFRTLGDSIKLARFREGSLSLYHSLLTRWSAARRESQNLV